MSIVTHVQASFFFFLLVLNEDLHLAVWAFDKSTTQAVVCEYPGILPDILPTVDHTECA